MEWTTPVGGTLGSAPAVTARVGGGPISVGVRGTDGNLYVTASEPAGILNLRPWTPSPGPGVILGKPAPVQTSDTEVTFFVRGTGNDIWSISFNPIAGAFSRGWRREVPGPFIASAPAAAVDPTGAIWLAAIGFDSQLRVFLKPPGEPAFGPAFRAAGPVLTGDPAIAVGFGPSIVVFGINANGQDCLAFGSTAPGTVGGATSLGGRHLAVGAVGTPGGGAVVSIGTDSRLYFHQLDGVAPFAGRWGLIDEAAADIFSGGVTGVSFLEAQGPTTPLLFSRGFGGNLLASEGWPWGH